MAGAERRARDSSSVEQLLFVYLLPSHRGLKGPHVQDAIKGLSPYCRTSPTKLARASRLSFHDSSRVSFQELPQSVCRWQIRRRRTLQYLSTCPGFKRNGAPVVVRMDSIETDFRKPDDAKGEPEDVILSENSRIVNPVLVSTPEPDASISPKLVSNYKQWRYRVFSGLFLGYTASYFTRGCFTYVAPILRAETGMTLQQLGVITSIFPMAHGVSKFASGVIADRINTRYFLALGLIATGILDMLMAVRPTVTWMSWIWGINGWVSAFIVPACVKLMTSWFTQSERGTWWGVWNSGANVGGFLTAIIAAYAASQLGWRMGMIVPGILGVIIGLMCIAVVRTEPAIVGLPKVDEVFGKPAPAVAVAVAGTNGTKAVAAGTVTAVKEESKNEIFVKYVLLNRNVWIMSVCYLFLYFIRQGITNWSHFYLMDCKGVKDAADAAARVSGRELGGLLGNLSSGFISDRFFGGRRIPVIIFFLVGISASLGGFWALPAGHRWLEWLVVSVVGFFVYGPHMLIGLAGVELAHKKASAAAIGFLGLISYLGAGIAGAPLTMLVKRYGWNALFKSMMVCCAISLVLLLPLWNATATPSDP